MKTFFSRLAAFLRKTWVWSLLLLIALALVIWFAGPLLAVADHRFWASPTSRLLSIAGLCLLWGLFLVFSSWRATRLAQAQATDEALQEQLREDERIREERAVLEERHQEADRVLKGARLYAGRSDRWRQQLPTYLVIGAPGSGKTSLLDFSGLEFPLNGDEQRRLTRDMAGTQYADWYFGEQAVLIDTAGRYLTHPTAKVDAAGWHTLLGLLRRRRARPLNGVLIALSVDELLQGGELQLEALARQTRQRLQDVHQRLGVEVPVYLVLTKADRLQGFEAFYDQLSREESDQVLGVTFRKDQDGTRADTLRQEFEELLRWLNSQVIGRIHQERDTQRRGRILDFPHQLGQLGERLSLFVELAFAGNRYQRASQLRGFYLTSAPRLEAGLDSLTGEIGRNLGMDGAALPRLQEGRARFIHHLLSRVVFAESRLACLDSKEQRRIDWGQRGLYAAAVGCLAVFAAVWSLGFNGNHDKLEQLRTIAEHRSAERATLTPADDARQVLQTLDHSYAATQVFPVAADAPYRERLGLYQGKAVTPTLHAAYRDDLERLLLPRVARQLEAQIRSNLDDREQLLGSLRAYLMLQDADHRDPEFLRQWLAADWSVRYSGDAVSQNGLSTHFERLLAEPFTGYALDGRLVAQARDVLRSESLAQVVYRMLRDQAETLPAYRLSQHLGPQGHWVQGAERQIPGFFTQAGYRNFYLARGADTVRAILRDNWVLGTGDQLSGADLHQLMVQMERLYFRDYANHWGELVEGLDLGGIRDLDRGAQQLAGLSGPGSPLLPLLAEIRNNTQFKGLAEAADEAAELTEKAAAAGGKAGKVAKLANAVAEKTQDALAGDLPDTSRKALERRFQPLHRLLDDGGAAGPELSAALAALDGLHRQLAATGRSSAPEQAAYDWARARMVGERSAIEAVAEQADRLPRPLSGWLDVLATDSWRIVLSDAHAFLGQRYRQELYTPYRQALHKRYPFDAQSESDVALADFGEFFRPSGAADRFFERYLQPFVLRAGDDYRVRQLDGRGLPLSPQLLTQLERIQRIRRSFFAADVAQPQIIFSLEPYSLDSNLGRAQFTYAGTELEYRHGPIAAMRFTWPAEEGNDRTRLVLEELGGRRVGIERNSGPWSLFRVLDLMKVDYHRGQDMLMVKANLGGRRVNYLLHGARGSNPFDLAELRRFRLPVSL